MRLGENLCQTPEEFKVWSQNLGHEGILTTFYSYGDVQDYRQAGSTKKLKELSIHVSKEKQNEFEMMFKKMMSNQ